MTPEQAIKEARQRKLRPLYVVTGEETYLVDEVVRRLRTAVDVGAGAGFNEDKFIAAETTVVSVIGAARTAPMMAAQRLVLVTGVERWDGKGKGDELDALAEYAADPTPETVMIISASKINGSRKLMRAAKKAGILVTCAPLKRRELPGWVQRTAKAKGHPISAPVADAIAELVGPELAPVMDALERLSLYVGPGGDIDEDALANVVTRVRQETVWALVDALGARDLAGALSALQDAYEPRDGGLPLHGAIAWRVRQLIKFQSMLRRGRSQSEAAKTAGVPPFKSAELERTVRRLPPRVLESWLLLLAEADLALKGSRRPGAAVLGTMLVDMCRR